MSNEHKERDEAASLPWGDGLVMLDGSPLLDYLNVGEDDPNTDDWTRGYHEARRRLYRILEPQIRALAGCLAAPASIPEGYVLVGWLYDWMHSSALGKPDEHFTSFTTVEAHARKHENPRAVYSALAAPQPQPAGVPQAGAHQDLADTIAAMLAAVGYTEEYARQWPKEKASVTFKRWFDEQIAAARGVAVAGANHAAFKAWADREGRDTACNYDTERSRWVFFSPMTADLWKCWQASSPVAPAAQLAPRMPSDERLHQLATNRCIAQQWPLHGREWVFNEEGLRNFADAVVSDTFPAAPSPEGEKK
jgi:hypothetical protein